MTRQTLPQVLFADDIDPTEFLIQDNLDIIAYVPAVQTSLILGSVLI